jgi:hypothetical protein
VATPGMWRNCSARSAGRDTAPRKSRSPGAGQGRSRSGGPRSHRRPHRGPLRLQQAVGRSMMPRWSDHRCACCRGLHCSCGPTPSPETRKSPTCCAAPPASSSAGRSRCPADVLQL